MNDNHVRAWAIVTNEVEINLKTIYDTRRGAIINWLVTECGFFAQEHMKDEEIESAWESFRADKGNVTVQSIIVSLARMDHERTMFVHG